jgi:hypothetical protein
MSPFMHQTDIAVAWVGLLARVFLLDGIPFFGQFAPSLRHLQQPRFIGGI